VRVFTVDGHVRSEAGDDQASANTVTPGYFAVMEIPLLSGHDFAALADESAPMQVIVNQEFVRRYLGGGEPLGRLVQARARNHAIVGVVGNSVANAFGEPPTPILYFSYRDANLASGEIHVRTRAGAQQTAVVDQLRRAMAQADPEVPMFNVRTLADHVDTNLFLRKVPARMFVVIGPLLLALAAIGIYAVVAYTSSLRRTEVGVRLAVGARPRQIVTQFLGERLKVIGIGAAIGWVAAWQLTSKFLPGSLDAPVFVAVPVLLLATATVACWVPARGASRLDPMAALRPE
jgi:hypothetical protein